MTPQSDLARLRLLLDRFVSGEERSLALAKEIEGIVATRFPDAEWFEEVELALAMYNPAGGEQYLDDEALTRVLRSLRRRL
jgi:hypothetical protein